MTRKQKKAKENWSRWFWAGQQLAKENKKNGLRDYYYCRKELGTFKLLRNYA